ncbi:MAG: S8 family serine peptidase, partial [Verrucomicrobiota bacterium]
MSKFRTVLVLALVACLLGLGWVYLSGKQESRSAAETEERFRDKNDSPKTSENGLVAGNLTSSKGGPTEAQQIDGNSNAKGQARVDAQPADSSQPSVESRDQADQNGRDAVETELSPVDAAAQLLSQKHDMSDPDIRAEIVAKLKALDDEQERQVLEKARLLNIPVSGINEDGSEFILRGFDGDIPLYELTENANAAISTAADKVRNTAPFSVSGSSVTIGMWEVNYPRATHQAFATSRLLFGQGASGTGDHATHVAGTLIGNDSSATRGMAPAAKVLAYSASGDSSEGAAVGASYPNEPNTIYLSNHSYGFGRGWGSSNVWAGAFSNDGNSANDIEDDFGRYGSYSISYDGLTYNLPYYLPFFSAGNHGNDGPPSNGATWYVGSTSGTAYTYDSSQHPRGDGQYKNGFDTCEGKKVAKNVMTVGAVSDAVQSGNRNISRANITSFSSTGPTDDGRIKPDIVANGVSLRSASSASDTATSIKSGTSMASPNAAGSAALLIDYYWNRFSSAMRAATLKGIIIHTADDVGNVGPDYTYGWGLMNTETAAALIREHADNGERDRRLIEDRLSTSTPTQSWRYLSNGSEPLKVTICWTDPPGTNKAGHENRAPALVNDLNLRVVGPGGTFYPWVMPHVGVWTVASLDDPATTGVNQVDNVEQVLLNNPQAGEYTILIDHVGSLSGGEQEFSIVVSGVSENSSDLTVDSLEVVEASGPEGGLFTPSNHSYQLTNRGTSSLSWTVSDTATWMDVSPSSGTLGAGASANVTASLLPAANLLSAGNYESLVTFSTPATGHQETAVFRLDVKKFASIPFSEDFESGLDAFWETTGTGTFRTIRSGANGPFQGNYHLLMDSSASASYARNELTLNVDLSGAANLVLSFWAREFSDELDLSPTSPFADGANFDGIAVSEDGSNWYSIFTFPSSFNSYREFSIDLDAAIDGHGLDYSDQFYIRFNQYDNYSIATDGIAIDQIYLGVERTP